MLNRAALAADLVRSETCRLFTEVRRARERLIGLKSETEENIETQRFANAAAAYVDALNRVRCPMIRVTDLRLKECGYGIFLEPENLHKAAEAARVRFGGWEAFDLQPENCTGWADLVTQALAGFRADMRAAGLEALPEIDEDAVRVSLVHSPDSVTSDGWWPNFTSENLGLRDCIVNVIY